ncbi:MAG TPA: sulfatase-like hydrolase/transferase [Burkholderiales bacterium]|nr:sulfatase-like hydrolase/transferase [Burkholderiales bacterium]
MVPTNFVFILADDLGYADLGCYGGRAPVSPCLDRLAAHGMRFTRGYANSPVCSPTRFALMTGRYQYRLRGAAEEPMSGRARGHPEIGLSPPHPTLPSLMHEAGYRTALIGKWHLGFPPHFGPLKSGYEEHFGPLSGGVDYFAHTDREGRDDLHENGEPVRVEGYLTDLLSQRAVDYVRRRAADRHPFLLSLHYTAPHWPWETREDAALAAGLAGNIAHLDGGSIHVYRRMIHHMDEGIGEVAAALAAGGLLEDTLIVFTSDNGGERFSDNWPLVGGKMDLTEGGIRVPYIAHWPRGIPAGGVTAQLAITMDWAATFLDAAGLPAHPDYPLDGMSLLPALRGPGSITDRALYWRMKHRDQRAMREGRWKYLAIGANEYLFDLEADERERANLGRRDPEHLAELRARWTEWNATMPAVPDDARVSLVYTDKDMP